MRYDNKQLVHIWAQQNEEAGHNDNHSLRFEGKSLYSYKTEIARFFARSICVSTHYKYSATTSTKHATHIPNAVSHLEHYITDLEMKDIPESWDHASIIIFRGMLKKFSESETKLKKLRSHIDFYTSMICSDANNIEIFFSKYIERKHKLTKEEKATYAKAKLLSSAYTSGIAISHDSRNVIECLKTVFGFDYEAKLAKEQELARARTEAQIRADEERKKEAQRTEGERLELFNNWHKDLNIKASFNNYPVKLRINRDQIETSHGAKVTKEEGEKLFHAICIARLKRDLASLSGYTVGDFRVTSIDDQQIVIGCHKIPMSEIHAIAKQLNLIIEVV